MRLWYREYLGHIFDVEIDFTKVNGCYVVKRQTLNGKPVKQENRYVKRSDCEVIETNEDNLFPKDVFRNVIYSTDNIIIVKEKDLAIVPNKILSLFPVKVNVGDIVIPLYLFRQPVS